MTKPRFQLRYWVPGALALVAFGLTAFAFVYDWLHANRAVEEFALRRATGLGEVITPHLERDLARDEIGAAAEELNRLVLVPNLDRALVVDEKDRVLCANDFRLRDQRLSETRTPGASPLVARARESKRAQMEITPDGAMLRAAFPFPIGPRPGESHPSRTAVFYTETDLAALKWVEMSGALRRSLVMGAAGGLACLGVWVYFTRTFTRRLNQLVESVALYSAGNRELRVPVAGRDELAVIGRAVNQMVSDLSAQHAALRESEERFRVVADSAPVMIWMSGPDKLCNYFNKPWLNFTGRALDQELGNGWAEGVHPDDLARCLEEYSKSFDARQPFGMEYRLRRHDGEHRWVEYCGVPRYDAGGNFAGYAGSCVDITERQRAERALAEERQRFQHLIEHTPVATWLEDYTALGTWMEQLRTQGVGDLRAFLDAHPEQLHLALGLIRVLDLNPAAVRQNAASSKAELLAEWPRLFDANAERAFVEQLAALWQGQISIDLEASSRRLDGRALHLIIHVEIPRRGEGVDLSRVIITATDITERKQAEEKLRESQRFLQSVTSATPHWIYVFDLDEMGVTYANRSIFRDLGHPLEAQSGDTWLNSFREFMAPGELPHLARLLDEWRILPDGQLRADEYSLRHADGSIHSFAGREVVFARRPDGTVRQILGTLADITSQKRGEEALRQSQEQLQRLFQSSPLATALYSASDGRIVNVNARFLELFQSDLDEVIGRTGPELNLWCDLSARDRLMDRVRLEKEVRGFEARLRNKQGREYDMLLSAQLIEMPNGPLVMVQADDITERKWAEERIAAFSDLGRKLSSVETAKEAGEIIIELADRLIGWDACLLDLYSEVGDGIQSVLRKDLIDGRRMDVPAVAEDEIPTPRARRIFEHGGELILREESVGLASDTVPFGDVSRPSLSLMFVPIRDRSRPIGILSIQSYQPKAYTAKDLELLQALADHCGGAMNRVYAEEEVRRLAAFPQMNPNPVLELSAVGEIQYCNAAATHLAGELGFARPGEMLPPETAAIVRECLATNKGRIRLEQPCGKRVISWSFHPILSLGTVHCYAADVTERRQLEEQFRQSQKMEAIGQLAGGVAHDFNNILAAMMMQAELAVMIGELPVAARDLLHDLKTSIERAASLTRQLLAFSRRQVMQPRLLNLNEVVTSLTKMLQRILGEDVHLQLNLNPRQVMVRADAGMLDQVLLNLVVNARDAMPDGGSVIIETAEKNLTEAEARLIPDATPGPHACLRVQDTGQGIPPEIMSRIFEPFFTTKEAGKGTGLGLATVFGIVKQHGGAITVESEAGRGATFQIYFPAVPASTAASVLESARPKPRGGSETILVVEDDPAVRFLTRAVLGRAGYRVLEASDGFAALRIWGQHQDPIQLLLTDIVMPEGLSGLELAARLTERNPRLRCIFTSGYSADIAGRELTLQPGQNFIQKPFASAELLETVRRSLDNAS